MEKSRRRTGRAAVRRERLGKIAPAPGSMCPNLKALDTKNSSHMMEVGQVGYRANPRQTKT